MSVRTTIRRVASTVVVAAALTTFAAPAFAGAGPGAPTPEQLQSMLDSRPEKPSCSKLYYKGTASAPTQVQLSCGGLVIKAPVNPGVSTQPFNGIIARGNISLGQIIWTNGQLRVWYTDTRNTATLDDDLSWVAIRNLADTRPSQITNLPTIIGG